MAKRLYYTSCFDKYKDDIKKTWATITELLNKKTSKNDYPRYFLINDMPVSDHSQIAREFNKYFVNIGPSLANSITPPPGKSYQEYLLDPCETPLHFITATKSEIRQIIDSLKTKTSCGFDGISNKLLKFIIDEIIEVMTLIINQMFSTGIFPDKLKIAKIVPIFKRIRNTFSIIIAQYHFCQVFPRCLKELFLINFTIISVLITCIIIVNTAFGRSIQLSLLYLN